MLVRAAMIRVSVAPSVTTSSQSSIIDTASIYCPALAGTHCTCLSIRDGQTESTWVIGYSICLQMVTRPSNDRAPMPRLSQTAMLPPTDAL